MDKEEIERRLKKLEKENQQIKKQNQKLKQIIQNKIGRSENRSKSSSDSKVSRREFLKKLGAGAIGLGALATPVASKMTISSNGIYKDGSEAFLGLSGAKTVKSNIDMGSSYDINNANSIEAQQLSVKNETLVTVGMSSDQTGLASSTYHTVKLDNKIKDERGEFDTTSYQFTPDESGWYHVDFTLVIDGGSGDDIIVKMRDKTAGSNVIGYLDKDHAGVQEQFHDSGLVQLTGGNNYEIVVYNYNSSFDILASQEYSHALSIRRAFR